MKYVLSILLLCFSLINTLDAQVHFNSSSGDQSSTYRKSNNQPTKQVAEKGFSTDKLIYGGGIFGGFSNGFFSAGVSPILGYKINNFFSAGISLAYQYNSMKNGLVVMHPISGAFQQYNLNYHIIAPGVWARAVLFKNFFLHTEFEYNITNYNNYEFDMSDMRMRKYRENLTVPCMLVGGGIRQPVSENSSFVIYALYDLLQNSSMNQRINGNGQSYSLSPYAGRIDIRLGLNIGF